MRMSMQFFVLGIWTLVGLILSASQAPSAVRSGGDLSIASDGLTSGGGLSAGGSFKLESYVGQGTPPGRHTLGAQTLESGQLVSLPVYAPRNVRTGGGKGTIRLVWDRNTETGIVGYNIYRSEVSSDFADKIRINSEILLDPVYIDDPLGTLPAGSDWYYQVEVVRSLSGETSSSISAEVPGVEGRYVMQLPDIRAFQTEEGVYIPYPISTLNARGITEYKFQILVDYPPDIVMMKLLTPSLADFERTALTENYQALHCVHNGPQHTVLIEDLVLQPGGNELTGEGHFVNLLFQVKAGIPEGTTGAFKFREVIFRDASDQPVSVDNSDIGVITVANSFRFGDVNGNGDIVLTDQEAAAKLVIGAPTDEVVKTAADLNADGVVDVADVVLFPGRFGNKKEARGNVPSKPKGGQGEFKMQFRDATFPSLPGVVDAFVSLDRPPSDSIGVAGIAFTIDYSTEAVELVPVDAVAAVGGFSSGKLFYDQRDLLRFWRPGQIRVALSGSSNKLIEGDFLRVRFKNRSSAPGIVTDVRLNTGKIARLSGEDLSWKNEIRLVKGRIFFSATTPTPTMTPTPTLTQAIPNSTFTSTLTPSPNPSLTATSINPDVAPTGAPDGEVDARDLLIFLSQTGGSTEPVLFDFARFWGGPFP